MNCATVFCFRIIDVLIPTLPVSFITPANGGYTQLLSFLRRGCLPVIFLSTLDWKLSRAFSICAFNTHVSDPKSNTAWFMAMYNALDTFGSAPYLPSTLYRRP